MITEIRNSRALPVVKPSSDAAITRNKTGHQHAPQEAATLTFLERREPKHSTPLGKGSIIDFYA